MRGTTSAVLAGLVEHSVFFAAAHDMLTQQRDARADNTYERCILRYTTPDLLIRNIPRRQRLLRDCPKCPLLSGLAWAISSADLEAIREGGP